MRFAGWKVDKKVDISPRAPAPNAESGFLKSGYSDYNVKYVQETRCSSIFGHLLSSFYVFYCPEASSSVSYHLLRKGNENQ
ncbi:hypothetical protein [Oscillospiraceae bacterium]|nr:hypothetical protein [Oscillospiraceae bacterium]